MKHSFFHSILYGSIRAFFVGITATMGIVIGIFLFIAALGGISATTSQEIERTYSLEILPNAKNVREAQSKKSPVILQLNIAGVIGLEKLNMGAIRQQLIESREGDLKDDRVKALLLHINTPGGTVVDADGIYRAIKDYKKEFKVPVYAYVDGLCASGGMYVASAADKIYSNEVSLIGSVGVISPAFFNVSKLIGTIGVESLTLSQGKGKDDMNPLRPWKPNEDEMYKNIIKNYYDTFVNIVTQARPNLSKEKLVEDYGAGTFPAAQAKEYGYIDGSEMNRSDVLKLLLKELSIDDDYYQVVQLEDTSWVSKIFSNKNPILQGKVTHTFNLPEAIDPKLSNQFLYLYNPLAG